MIFLKQKIDALIIGPPDTPYQDGFFHFKLQFPSNYPFRPPRVKFLTTSNEKVRFNPNLYNCGKVCLSILGTWVGPGWLPSQSLSSVLISIQSLLSSKPYHNEPGLEKAVINQWYTLLLKVLNYSYWLKYLGTHQRRIRFI